MSDDEVPWEHRMTSVRLVSGETVELPAAPSTVLALEMPFAEDPNSEMIPFWAMVEYEHDAGWLRNHMVYRCREIVGSPALDHWTPRPGEEHLGMPSLRPPSTD